MGKPTVQPVNQGIHVGTKEKTQKKLKEENEEHVTGLQRQQQGREGTSRRRGSGPKPQTRGPGRAGEGAEKSSRAA